MCERIPGLEDACKEEDRSIHAICEIEGYEDFYKETKDAKIWHTAKNDKIGEINISFERKKIYNLFADYPNHMSKEEVEIFEK